MNGDNRVQISIVDPRAMFTVIDNPDLEPLVEEARAKLQAALDSL